MKHMDVAMGIMKKNRMSKGGAVKSAASRDILKSIMAKKMKNGGMCYSKGGEIMPLDEDSEKDDFLSDEGDENPPLFEDNDDFLAREPDAEEDPKMKRRGMLKKIFER